MSRIIKLMIIQAFVLALCFTILNIYYPEHLSPVFSAVLIIQIYSGVSMAMTIHWDKKEGIEPITFNDFKNDPTGSDHYFDIRTVFQKEFENQLKKDEIYFFAECNQVETRYYFSDPLDLFLATNIYLRIIDPYKPQ